MKKDKQEEMIIGFKPSRWVVSEMQECPTSMTLYPHISLEDIDLPRVGELPESNSFQEDEIEIV